MIILLLFAAASINQPNGMSYGYALKNCAVRAVPTFENKIVPSATVAHQAVSSCTKELSAMREALRTIVGHYVSPNSPTGRQAVEQHMGINVRNAELVIATEIDAARKTH